ncbi:hypothetical protein Syun_023495 [Stephania yunnanensis]|uniref:Uncharacterized protein n=1 Tax=Stephania yunnanensis TaxID=152371 RepID=A0AAP0FP77_9MAGN
MMLLHNLVKAADSTSTSLVTSPPACPFFSSVPISTLSVCPLLPSDTPYFIHPPHPPLAYDMPLSYVFADDSASM